MQWEIFFFVIGAVVFFFVVFFSLETANMAKMSVRDNLRDMWQAFFGKGQADDPTPNPRLPKDDPPPARPGRPLAGFFQREEGPQRRADWPHHFFGRGG
ncbi:MAG: hypothetical protein HC915_20695 [Anaerolineae bacterium]|nr:hypothetical protein [Anaerolineae bacterium]